MYRKTFMRGKDLKEKLYKLYECRYDTPIAIKLKNGERVYPTTGFQSIVDDVMSDQYPPDIGIRAHKEPGSATITVGELVESCAAVEWLERRAEHFDQLEVVVYLHEVDAEGKDEDYPDEYPVENIVIANGNVVLVCNEF